MRRALLALTLTPLLSGQVTERDREAPKVEASITFADGAELRVRYTAITFAGHGWKRVLRDPSRHAEFNALAERHPLGMARTTHPVIAGDNYIHPGEYDLYVSVDSDHAMLLNLRKRGDAEAVPYIWHLHLKPVRRVHPRLGLLLRPGAEGRTGSVTLGFGVGEATVSLEIRGPTPGKEGSASPSDAAAAAPARPEPTTLTSRRRLSPI